jgi:hypothetical protein
VSFVRAGAAAVLHDAPAPAPAGMGPNLESRLFVLHEQLSKAIIPSSRHPSGEITPGATSVIPSQNYGCARDAAFVLPELNLDMTWR